MLDLVFFQEGEIFHRIEGHMADCYGGVHINPSSVVAISPVTRSSVVVDGSGMTLSSGDRYHIKLSVEELINKLNGLEPKRVLEAGHDS